MTNSLGSNHLYIYSTDLAYFPDNIADFITRCRELELVGMPASNLGDNYYLVGDKFLQWVSFLGCSPYLKTTPKNDSDTDYCSVFIPGSNQGVRFISIPGATPRCPECRKVISNRSELWCKWEMGNEDKTIECEHCHTLIKASDLDWRKNAGIVKFSLKISNIFPKEALPADQLLSSLSDFTGVKWKYFYA